MRCARAGRARLAAGLVAAIAAGATSGRAHAQAAGANVDMTAPVPAPLLARAASVDPAERAGAITSLGELGTPAAWGLVSVMLERDVDPRVRFAAAVSLGGSHDAAYASTLGLAARADPDPSVRAAAASSAAIVAPFAKRPKAAAGFSALCPGCGYFYLGDPVRAIKYLTGAATLVLSAIVAQDYLPPVYDSSGTENGDRATPLLMAVQNLWFYGVFASYRDARLARGDVGAHYPVAREQLRDLLFAPFNPRVLKSPWVWAGLPLMFGAAIGASALIASGSGGTVAATRTLFDGGGVRFFGHHYGTGTGVALGEGYNVSVYLPVGVGEEALFRGVIQAGLSETSLGLWGGWAVGSAIFGAAHTFNYIGDTNGVREAALAVPYLMLTGSYLGYVYIHTNFSLLTGAAIHFWYDFALSTVDFIADPDHQPFVARFGMPF